MHNYKLLIAGLILSFALCSHAIRAQVDSTKLDLENVEVVKQFKSQLFAAEIIGFAPPLIKEQEILESPSFQYAINPPKALNVNIPEPEIRTLAFVEDREADDSKNGLVRMGYGNINSADIGGSYNYFIEDWFEIGLYGNFYNAKDTFSDNDLRKMNQIDGGIYAGYFLNPNTKVKLSFDGDWSKRFRYAEMDSVQIEKDTEDLFRKNVSNRFIGLNFNHNSFASSGFSFDAAFYLNQSSNRDTLLNINNDIKSKDDALGLHAKIGKQFNKTHYITAYLETHYESYSQNLDTSRNLNLLVFKPFISAKINNVTAKVGVHFDNQDIIWPISSLNVRLTDQYQIELSSDVDYAFQSLNFINRINPFTLDNYLAEYYSNKSIALEGKARYSQLELNLGFVRFDHTNLAVFSELNNDRSFSFSNEEIEEIQLYLNGTYNLSDKFNGNLSVRKKFFSGYQDQDFVPYMADLEIDIKLTQQLIENKLSAYQIITYQNSRNTGPSDSRLEAFTDISVGIDFRINDLIMFYGNANNLLGKRYNYFEGYDGFGTNFHAGLKIIL